MSTHTTQHTPGPWRIAERRDGIDGPITGWSVYRLSRGAEPPLIFPTREYAKQFVAGAAAPDLLAACRAAEAWIVQMERSGAITQTREPIATLRAAIAKTEGGQP